MKQAFLQAAVGLGLSVDEASFEHARQALIDRGLVVKGRGRGGSLRRAQGDGAGFDLNPTEKPPETPPREPGKAASGSSPRRPTQTAEEPEILSYRHADLRKNNPEVGVVSSANDPDVAPTSWRYDPHIDPALQFDMGRARVEKLIDDALASDDLDTMRAALEELRRDASPYLNWTGKAERTSFEVETV